MNNEFKEYLRLKAKFENNNLYLKVSNYIFEKIKNYAYRSIELSDVLNKKDVTIHSEIKEVFIFHDSEDNAIKRTVNNIDFDFNGLDATIYFSFDNIEQLKCRLYEEKERIVLSKRKIKEFREQIKDYIRLINTLTSEITKIENSIIVLEEQNNEQKTT